MLFISWFNPYGYRVFSFKTRKFSFLLRNVLVSLVVVCFLICSIKSEFSMLLKIMGFFVEVFTHQNWGLWFSIVLMIIDADVKRSLTFSNVLKLAYTALEQINKVFTFACKVVKYLKGFFCPVTLECFCMLHLFTTKIVHSWEALWTIFWLLWLFRVSTFNFVFQDEIASD